MALKGEGVSSPVATSLDAAAGLAQRQKWGLILPSSARVSRLTYQTVIGVRYPELVRPTPTGWQYGRYVSEEATLQGGFLPVFWDVPKSTMHAVSDVGALVEWLQEHIVFGQNSADNLAVLHNQNHMVHARRYVALDQAGFLHPLGVRHFYDGFSLRAGVSIRPAALAAFDLHEDELSTDLIVSQAAVVDRGWIDHQEQPVDQNAPEADRRNVPEEVISVSDGEVDRESTIGGCSSQASCSTTSSDEDSDTSEPARSEVSVQDSMMEHAYHSLQNAFSAQDGQLVGGDGTLNQLELLPFHWPLAKLTLPLKFGVNRLEGLVVGFLMELMATKSQPWLCRRQISSFAKTLTVRVATYLAKEIASLFRPVLQHPVMALTDDDTLSLLTSDFWIRPVYEELLYAASRFNRSSGAEHKRPTSNLVKIASFSKDKSSDMMNAGIHHTTMTEWIGADCPVDFLNV